MTDMIGEDVTVKILITVHRDTRTMYKKAAAKYGITMSEWVRSVCDDAAVKVLKMPFNPAALHKMAEIFDNERK